MKVLITGNPERSRTKKLLKLLEKAGHAVVMSATVGGGLAIQEVIVNELGEQVIGKAVKVEASNNRERMRVVTPGKANNRKSRRNVAASKQRRKRKGRE